LFRVGRLAVWMVDKKPFRAAGRLIGVLAQAVGDTAVLPVLIRLEVVPLTVRPGITGRVEIVRKH
jgi:hypothetical protein